MNSEPHQDHPPVFKSWKGWYIFLLVVLLIEIVFFYLLTIRFS
jgi:hypothetical protein